MNRKTIKNDYLEYRGKCKELAEKECHKNNTLILIKGWYYCPIWNVKEQHWWCIDKDKNIIDPSKYQYPSKGQGIYEEYKGIVSCSECNKQIIEKDIDTNLISGKYIFCTSNCYMKFVGI